MLLHTFGHLTMKNGRQMRFMGCVSASGGLLDLQKENHFASDAHSSLPQRTCETQESTKFLTGFNIATPECPQ